LLKTLEVDNDNDNVKLYDIRLKEGANVFFAGRVGTHNCGSAIASASYTTELLHGMHIDKATLINNGDIAKHLRLPPVKLHCAEAIHSAIENYKQKNKK
jgi:NifU-like protein involved in Fe-S cluster formation